MDLRSCLGGNAVPLILWEVWVTQVNCIVIFLLPIQSLLVASSTGTFQETFTGLPNETVDTDRESDLFCSITLMSSAALSYKTR